MKNYLNNKNDDENRIEEYIKSFDEEFDANTEEYIKEYPLLNEICNDFAMKFFKPSKLYNKVWKNKKELMDKLFKEITNEQRMTIKKMEFCNQTMLEDMERQAIIYGYAMCTQLQGETIKNIL